MQFILKSNKIKTEHSLFLPMVAGVEKARHRDGDQAEAHCQPNYHSSLHWGLKTLQYTGCPQKTFILTSQHQQ